MLRPVDLPRTPQLQVLQKKRQGNFRLVKDQVVHLPERFRFLLSLNPMTGVVEGFRWALLGPGAVGGYLSAPLIGISVVISLGVLVSGAYFFRSTERIFADIV